MGSAILFPWRPIPHGHRKHAFPSVEVVGHIHTSPMMVPTGWKSLNDKIMGGMVRTKRKSEGRHVAGRIVEGLVWVGSVGNV